MSGKIRTNEVCAQCHGAFKETVVRNRVDLLCSCGRRPMRYYVDARGFGLKKLYKDRRGVLLSSYELARALYDEIERTPPGQLDRSLYDPSLRRAFNFERESATWLKTLTQDKSAAYARHCESFFRIHLTPEFGREDLRDLNAKMIEVFYRKLIERKKSPKTMSSILKALKAFLKYEHRLGVIPSIPLFPQFKVRALKEKGWLHTAHQTAILAAISERHRLPFEVMMRLGIRPGEVIALRAENICAEGFLRVTNAIDEVGNLRTPKSGRGREMRVMPDLHDKLMAQAKGKLPKAWLFTNLVGGHYSRESLHQIWIRACGKVGIRIGMYQGCRHSRATQLYIEGQDAAVEAVARELGNTVDVAKGSYILSVRDER